MFNLAITKIYPLYPTKAYIEFTAENPRVLRVPTPTIKFYIQRSETKNIEASWETINPTGTTEFFFVDDNVRLLSFYNTTYYRLYVVYDNKKYYSEPTGIVRNIRRDEFLRRRKILHDEAIVLQKFSGRRVAILKRRHVGERCPRCYDPNTGNTTRSHCRDCMGTGFLEPYYKPFITYAARLPVYKEVDEIGDLSGTERDNNKYQIMDYPTVMPQDLIVDLEVNDRYKIDRVEQTEMRRHPVHQELIITKLARTSIEYKWDIGEDLTGVPDTVEV